MRTLRFIVNKQMIRPDPDCDFSGLVPGTKGYLQAEFIFSPEWKGCTKVASFWSRSGEEFTPQVLKDEKTCIIPEEALAEKTFDIQIIGKRENFKLITNKWTVRQKGEYKR